MPSMQVVYCDPALVGESEDLARRLAAVETVSDGTLYLGYPSIGEVPGVRVDGLLIAPRVGLTAFVLQGDRSDADGEEIALQVYQDLRARIGQVAKLRRRLQLLVPILAVVVRRGRLPHRTVEENAVVSCGSENIAEVVANQVGLAVEPPLFAELTSLVQCVRGMNHRRPPRISAEGGGTRGAILARMEAQIASLDHGQLHGALEMVSGVQRLRGLAGSGKTVVLARKAAELRERFPDASVAVVHFTRALGPQLSRHIHSFLREPDDAQTTINVLPAWGGRKPGLYSTLATFIGETPHTLSTARNAFGGWAAFAGACRELAAKWEAHGTANVPFDWILVDEAQDLPTEFFRLLWRATAPPHRIVFAYDELQSLDGAMLPGPAELFDVDASSIPLVTPEFGPKPDVVLPVCYRTTPWALAAAHGVGLGVHAPRLIQWVDRRDLWEAVGYSVEGKWEAGGSVRLARREDSSPRFFFDNIKPDEAIGWKVFEDRSALDDALVDDVRLNIQREHLRPEDILIIFCDSSTYKTRAAAVQVRLLDAGLGAQIAGEDGGADTFTLPGSVTLAGVHRAKGNEAGFVYVVDAGVSTKGTPAERNMLFTAVTRSKAWVRIWGCGDEMTRLASELDAIRADKWALSVLVPTEDEKRRLRLLGQDLSPEERRIAGAMDALGRDISKKSADEIARIVDSIAPSTREFLLKSLREKE